MAIAAVDLTYIAYTARTQACGDWSENESFTLDNSTPKRFGCSVQQNIAAMVADPATCWARAAWVRWTRPAAPL